MCDNAGDSYPDALKMVPDCYMTQKMCYKLSILITLKYNLLLIAIRLRKCVIKLLIEVFLHLLILLIDTKLNKFVIVLFLKICFCKYIANRYKTQKMCDEVVDDCLAALKFTPDLFVMSKMIKKLLTTLYADDNILLF